MNCKKCGTDFKPKPARRVVCDKCARVKREPSSLVSVGYDPALMAALKAGRRMAEAEVWRERNVIPFPRTRVKPPTRPFKPFNGGKAA